MSRAHVRYDDIVTGLDRLGLRARPVVVHASLKSFGQVEGGAATVAQALVRTCASVLAPAFNFESNGPPPPGDRPTRNGTDYTFYDDWKRPVKPWIKETADIDRSMGVVPRAVRDLPGALRSDHPWHSWVAYGRDAARLIEPHPWTLANPEIERLADLDGEVLLLGVGLKSCTAVHVAEERAGRRPFIRWNTGRDGVVRRIRVSGCSKGFDRLWPPSADLFREDRIGDALVRVAPLQRLLQRLTDTILSDPHITICSPTCPFCRDMALGGPPDAD